MVNRVPIKLVAKLLILTLMGMKRSYIAVIVFLLRIDGMDIYACIHGTSILPVILWNDKVNMALKSNQEDVTTRP